MTTHPLVVVVTGVSGSGKSTVGAALAERLGWAFFDGDDYHPAANVDKMRRGIALDDDDRAPWLERLHDLVHTRVDMGAPAVLACSALKRSYRAILRAGLPHGTVRFAHLDVDPETLAARLGGRRGHYVPPSLLASQLATLELPTPDEAVVVDANGSVAATVDQVIATLAVT